MNPILFPTTGQSIWLVRILAPFYHSIRTHLFLWTNSFALTALIPSHDDILPFPSVLRRLLHTYQFLFRAGDQVIESMEGQVPLFLTWIQTLLSGHRKGITFRIKGQFACFLWSNTANGEEGHVDEIEFELSCPPIPLTGQILLSSPTRLPFLRHWSMRIFHLSGMDSSAFRKGD